MLSSVKVVFILFAIAAVPFTYSRSQPKLKVLILYESLCPDSARFMAFQLAPNYDTLKDTIDITFVPFGKSHSHNNGATFTCQHGPDECENNRIQSCVLEQTSDPDVQANFVMCQMTYGYRQPFGECALAAGLSKDVRGCVASKLGTKLQLEAERITKHYRPTFIPTIIYDGVFDQELQDRSLDNFKGVVCGLLQERNDEAFHTVC